jgi:hypothetical protein
MRQLAENFWTFRGDFKIAGFINLGTHMSLVRRADGSYLVIDSYALEKDDRRALLELTDGGRAVEAILNVHPFHTLHCNAAHKLLPHARLIGTRRHHGQAPDLPWDEGFIEEAATQAEFAEDLEFSVPRGVDFISEDDHVHVASVLVRHRMSGIVHVDDTINVLAAPGFLGRLLPQSKLKFHPQLAKALQKRAGAADDYAARRSSAPPIQPSAPCPPTAGGARSSTRSPASTGRLPDTAPPTADLFGQTTKTLQTGETPPCSSPLNPPSPPTRPSP